MLVKDVMTRGVECARHDDSIARVAQRMRELNVGSLPVCGDDNQLIGMITDRDITTRATAEGFDPCGICVRSVMTPEVITVHEEQNVEDAVRLMEDNQIRRIVVLGRERRLAGILSLGDLAVRVGSDELSGEALELVSSPAEPHR